MLPDKKWVLTRFLILVGTIGPFSIGMWFLAGSNKRSGSVHVELESRPCIDEMVTLTARPQERDPDLTQVTRASCSHKEHRITDIYFGGTYFMCRCNPDKIFGNSSFWVDPVYKQEIEHKMHEASLKAMGYWMDHSPEPKYMPGIPCASSSVKKP